MTIFFREREKIFVTHIPVLRGLKRDSYVPLPFLTETDEWSFGPSMNNKRSNVGCVTLLNEKDQPTIMVGGGFNRFKMQKTTEFLASGASQWTVGPNLPRRSKDTTLVRLPNKQGVAMIGGMGSAAGEN